MNTERGKSIFASPFEKSRLPLTKQQLPSLQKMVVEARPDAFAVPRSVWACCGELATRWRLICGMNMDSK